MVLVAKPVVANQYWILKQDNRKVGNITAGPDGVAVKIDNQTSHFKSINMVEQRAGIKFEQINLNPAKVDSVLGFQVTGKIYNSVWDVKHRLPLFTKKLKSKSWYAAGWYRVQQHSNWKIIQNPKLILLQRYTYQGPYKTKDEAQQ
jgi:hypothetical protein